MKKLLNTFLFLLLPFFATAQSQQWILDSLHQELKNSNDTIKMKTLEFGRSSDFRIQRSYAAD